MSEGSANTFLCRPFLPRNIDRVTTTLWLTKFCRAVFEIQASIKGYKVRDVITEHLSMPAHRHASLCQMDDNFARSICD